MSQSPPHLPAPAPAPASPSRSHAQITPLSEDFPDFEGDPTSINQIPRDNAQGTPRPAGGMHPPPGAQPQFASASPSLSHIGGPAPQQYGTNPGQPPAGLQPQPQPL